MSNDDKFEASPFALTLPSQQKRSLLLWRPDIVKIVWQKCFSALFVRDAFEIPFKLSLSTVYKG